jgi:predicted DNA-binding transcriptional regulator AlpA
VPLRSEVGTPSESGQRAERNGMGDGKSRMPSAANDNATTGPWRLLQPRGLSRVEAAAYIGISPSLFDQMVGDGRMPGPKRINSRVVWDRFALDVAFDALPDRDQAADDEWAVAA